MGFFKDTNAQDITKKLYQILDEVTDHDVLRIDQAFYAAQDKHAFLAQFEANQQGEAAKINPILLERWTHYRWLRLELLYLANQRAMLSNIDPNLPQVDSVNRAILEAKEAGLSLPQSLAILRKIKLQVVSTEHPTDPLLQFARDTITQIANVMESDLEDAPNAIRGLLDDLQKSDAIPPAQRTVEDEVQRNIKTLEALYDVVPDFAQSVLAAYKTYYPESFPQYEDSLWQVLASGMILDASWAGFDADGNDNVTPEAMHKAIHLHRTLAAEKHSSTLEVNVLAECKRIEQRLRQEASADVAEQNKLNWLVAFQHALRSLQQEIKNAQHNTDYLTQRYNAIVNASPELLRSYPSLKTAVRVFGIQLRSYGMTYGAGHIRQDSSVFVSFWSTLLKDLQQEPAYQQFAIFKVLNHRNYAELALLERMELQKLLLNGSPESNTLLKAIYDKHSNSQYRNDARYQTAAFARVRRELERFELASQHPDMFENVIISNCESAANIFEVEALLRLFPHRSAMLKVVPLLEKRPDLENYELILLEYLKFVIQAQLQQVIPEFEQLTTRDELRAFVAANSEWSGALKQVEFEVMVGFSDTERVSGIPALLSIQQVKENILLMAKDLGLQVKFYHGPGGDANRGGLARRDEKGTLQGNARSNLLTTPQSTLSYREGQFYRAFNEKANPSTRIELANKPPHIKESIEQCQKEGIAFYEHLHDAENGLGKLFGAFLGHGSHWLVSILNLSSRASQRGGFESQGDRAASVQKGGLRPSLFCDLDKLRAITATQCKEVLRDNSNLILGPGRALRSLNKLDAARILDSSATMRDIFLKALLGLSFADYSVTAHALFAEYPELLPKTPEQRAAWAKECEESYPERLKQMSVDDLLNNKEELRIMLSRLFALLEEEAEQTKKDLDELMKSIHFSERSSSKKFPYPEWQVYTEHVIREVDPISLIMARQNHHVIQGRHLDEVYAGLNQHVCSESKLSGVNRLLGNLGAANTASRIMPPPFCAIDFSHDLRPGVTRAEVDTLQLGKSLNRSAIGLKFFDKGITGPIEDALKRRLKQEPASQADEAVGSMMNGLGV